MPEPVYAPLGRRATWLAFLAPLVLLSIRLGAAPLFDVDEGAFSEATREMFERQDFLSTYLNGADRFDKPILIYWLQATSVAVFGISEFAFRLPSVLAAAVWCQAVALFAAPRIGAKNALFGCGIAATCLGVFVIGRAATADALLNALLALALFDAWRVVEQIDRHGQIGLAIAKPALRRAYLWIALGALTKGPVAILIPVAAVFLFALVASRVGSRFELRNALRLFFDPLGWVILIAVAAPWYVAALVIHGRAFVDGFLLRHNVERFTGTLQGHSGSAFYYVAMVPLLMWPWLAWLVSAIATLVRSLRAKTLSPLATFLWIWCVFVVVFFSVSGTKLPHYALYGCTPLFVLCATERERVTRIAFAALPVVLLAAFVVALPDVVAHASVAGWIRDPLYRALASRAEVATPAFYRPLAWLGAGAVVVALAWPLRGSSARRRARPQIEPDRRALGVATRVAVAAVVVTLLLGAIGAPYLGELLQGPVKRAAAVAATRSEPAVTWNFHMPSFAVYRQRVTPIGTPRPGELALTRVDRLPVDADVERLFEDGGVVLVRRR